MLYNTAQAKNGSDRMIDEFSLAAVLWAADRTLLSWIRTSLTMISFGVIIHQFANYLQHDGLVAIKSQFFGIGLWIFGIIILLFASRAYFSLLQQLMNNEYLDVMRPPLTLFVAIGLCLIGVTSFSLFLVQLSI